MGNAFPSPPETTKQFLQAVESGDCASVKLGCEQYDAWANLTSPTESKTPVLLTAVESQNIEIVTCLITHKADINLCDTNQHTSLMTAASRGLTEIAQVLIAHQADISLLNRDGDSALTMAAASGSMGIARRLLELKADPVTPDQWGSTILVPYITLITLSSVIYIHTYEHIYIYIYVYLIYYEL